MCLNSLIDTLYSIMKEARCEENIEDVRVFFSKNKPYQFLSNIEQSVRTFTSKEGKFVVESKIKRKKKNNFFFNTYESFDLEPKIFDHEYEAYNYFIDYIMDLHYLIAYKDFKKIATVDQIISRFYFASLYLSIIADFRIDYKNIKFNYIYKKFKI